MKSWDHLDVVITVGVCAVILGAGMFFFAFGGAPSGFLDHWFVATAPETVDQNGVSQAALGQAIIDAERIRQLEGAPWGMNQERLGQAIVASVQAQQARAGLVPYFRDAARESLQRMQGMIQETAGSSIVQASQKMWRAGNTEPAQLAFIETLGRIRAGMILREQAARPMREEALGWTVVGGVLAMDRHQGQTERLLGAAVRDVGIVTARIEEGAPLAQETLGSAVLVASAAQEAAASGRIPSAFVASAPGVSGFQALHEIPYPAAVLLFAGLFVMIWGLRSVADSGTSLPAYGTPAPEADQYRKVG